jgi:hypothetical protein
MTQYATQTAISRAYAIGLRLSEADWREVFLAISDEVAGERAAQNVCATFIGAVRDGAERWTVTQAGRQFDVIYDPETVRIVLIIRPRDRNPRRTDLQTTTGKVIENV